jgi:hypothetical protein
MRHFIRHYLEMVAAMFLGMGVLYTPIAMAFDPGGAAALLGMGATMTIPMVAWMRYRGHDWRATGEMAGAMLAPTFVAIPLIGSVDFHSLMMVEHVGMLAAMLVAMLARPGEYVHKHAVSA